MTYYVTAVKQDSAEVVTHVKVGAKMDGADASTVATPDAVKRIHGSGEVWYTAPIDPSTKARVQGARIHAHPGDNKKVPYLHTDANSKVKDNLESLPKFS